MLFIVGAINFPPCRSLRPENPGYPRRGSLFDGKSPLIPSRRLRSGRTSSSSPANSDDKSFRDLIQIKKAEKHQAYGNSI